MSGARDPRLTSAAGLIDSGRIGMAIAALRDILAGEPGLAPAHELMGVALARASDRIGAVAELRAALAIDPMLMSAAVRLAALLPPTQQDAAEAAALLEPFIDTPEADSVLLTHYGRALKTLGRRDEAVEAYARAASLDPASGVARHNLAGALGEAHRFVESEAAVRQAIDLGVGAPESWLVLGRAHLGQNAFDEAETALREAIRRRPSFADAQAELAQLIWMRTGDLEAAVEPINAALALQSLDGPLTMAKAKLYEYAGDRQAAYAALVEAVDVRSGDVRLNIAISNVVMPLDADVGLAYAQRAVELDPQGAPARSALAVALLAVGRPAEAARLAEDLRREWPFDQYPVTLAATAWRMMEDARYRELYDYDRLVSAQPIETPRGWSDMASYLRDLAESLRATLQLSTHPLGQSLRNGVQSGQSLTRSDDPTIKAFFAATEDLVRAYMQVLRQTDDRPRHMGVEGYRITGAWSVLLRPGGHHVDHIHPMGWIASAFHVEVPKTIEEGHQGWLKFGEPGLPTSPVLGPEHFVKPEAGTLVLFPSYMWHGTVPFGGDAPRLTLAFDAVPA